MPASLFWALESCIPRVMAELDLRAIGVRQSVTSEETLKQQKDNLVLQMGEVYVTERTKIVEGEAGALDKLKALM